MKNYICFAMLLCVIGCGSNGQLDAKYIESMQATATPTALAAVISTPEVVVYQEPVKTEAVKPEKEKPKEKENKKEAVAAVPIAVVVSSLAVDVTASPTPVVTVTATATPDITPTASPTVTVSPSPTVTASPTPTASPVPTPTPFLTMVSIPEGTFPRNPFFQTDTNATNTSFVSAFHMSEKEITREQYVIATGFDDFSWKSVSTGITDPMQNVNWYHTLVFCNKLSLAEGLTPVYTIGGNTNPITWGEVPTASNSTWNAVSANWNATGYRLPTEMEWLWAAQGATNNYSKAFSGSNGSNLITNYAVFSSATTKPVGSKLANELGLFDMSGNVAEWVWDLSAAYPNGQLIDYKGAETSFYRRYMGGSYDMTIPYISFMLHYDPYYRDSTMGFRVVRK